MAGFPEKVSDWTVIYFYPQTQSHLGYSDKPVNEIQSLSRKPVNDDTNVIQYFSNKRCTASITPIEGSVKEKFTNTQMRSIWDGYLDIRPQMW